MPSDRERIIPISTYRVQLSAQFTLDDLADQVPYMARLGLSHVYLSPIFQARPSSPHGYDIVNYGCVNDELGGRRAWRRFASVLQSHGMGAVLDVVPNHMAADPVNNPVWRQVLREGPRSQAARFFDIDWRPLTGLWRDKVLLPCLEEPYGQSLINGAVQLERAGDDLRIRCGALHLPVSPASVDRLGAVSHIDEAVATVNRSPHLLHELLEEQHYRLAYWRPANDEINYRRFFGINELIATHAEDETVFAHTHSLVLTLAGEGVVTGVRVDHVDGLLDPVGYLQQLRAALESASGARPWIVVEKILEASETLDTAWPVDGTTGYDALDALNRLFVSGRGVRVLRRFFHRLADDSIPFRDEAHRCKQLIMYGPLLSGVTMLAHEMKRVADASWTTRDISLNSLQEALVEFVAALPVYRTYLGTTRERAAEREIVIQTIDSAIRGNPSMDASAFAFLRSLMLGEPVENADLAQRRAALVKRLQQYTSGVHAKGVEDTAFYRDNTLLALNEVGGSPAGPALTTRAFHRFNERRARLWPHSMTATSTHDTKLSEDARIRIATLSIFPESWTDAVRRWRTLNAPFRLDTRRGSSPDVRDEYRLYQILVGVWNETDFDSARVASSGIVQRVVDYMRKAAREAQLNTSWMRPDADYECGLEGFVRGVLTEDRAAEFRESLALFVGLILPVSTCHSISQLVLKCLMPGVPDFYQGCEDWSLRLTDPDNRRPVNFPALADRVRRMDAQRPSRAALDAGDLKIHLTSTLLEFRRDHQRWLRDASYRALRVRGSRSGSVVAFERRGLTSRVVVAVPRVSHRLPTSCWPSGSTFWEDTEVRLPSLSTTWSNLFTGHEFHGGGAWQRLAGLTEAVPWLVLTPACSRLP